MKIAYIDVDNLAYEGIRSGATIGNFKILKGFTEKGLEGKIYQVYNVLDSNLDRRGTKLYEFKQIEGIPVEVIKFDLLDISHELLRTKHDIIVSFVPSVFFSESDCELLKIMRSNCKKLILIIADALYPTKVSINNKSLYIEYINVLNSAEIIAVSRFIQNSVLSELGVESSIIFPIIIASNQSDFSKKNLFLL